MYDAKEYLVAAGVLSTFGLLGNVLVIILIYREKERRTTTAYLLLSLAVADIANLLCIDGFVMLVKLVPKHLENTEKIVFITYPAKIVANFALALIAFERYNALVKTMMPLALLTKRRVIIGAFSSWILGTAFSLPIVLREYCKAHAGGNSEQNYFPWFLFFIGYLLPIVVVVFCYASILKGLYFDGTILSRDITTVDSARLKEKKRLVGIVVVITLVFIACNVPIVIILLVQNFAGCAANCIVLLWIQLILGCNSSVVNPYIYGLHSEKQRNELKKLFCMKKENSVDATADTAAANVCNRDVQI